MFDQKSLFVPQLSMNFELGLAREIEAKMIFVLLLNRRSELVVGWRRQARNFVQYVEDAAAFPCLKLAKLQRN